MYVVERLTRWFGAPSGAPGPADPLDMRGHVRTAYALLCEANRKAIQVPSEIVAVITEARKAAGPELPDGLEARFWNAYGLLSSSIGPAARARTFYRNVFYVVLVILLVGQFFQLGGDLVRSKLAENEKQLAELRRTSANPAARVPPPRAAPAGAPVPTAPAADQAADPNVTAGNGSTAHAHSIYTPLVQQRLEDLSDTLGAYYKLGRSSVHLVTTVANLPFRLVGLRPFKTPEEYGGDQDEQNQVMKGQLDLILAMLAGYLLPMMYGLLGACAFVLRKLSDEIDKFTYAHDARVRYSLRLNVGLLSGLAVGWFIKPGTGSDATLVSLSPLALAFIAGYGSDLFFAALDKIVQAFAPTGGSASATVREITTGGITTTVTQTRETHVAGPEATPKDEPKPRPAETPDPRAGPTAEEQKVTPAAVPTPKAA